MRHRRKTIKLGMEKKHRESVLANLAKSLILNERVDTTFARAKAGQRYAERLVTLARRGDGHARRLVFARIQDKAAVDRLFNEVGPRYGERDGGYTRVVRLGARRGDGAEIARLMFVEP
jgi:large subunit ribosomal protein L17